MPYHDAVGLVRVYLLDALWGFNLVDSHLSEPSFCRCLIANRMLALCHVNCNVGPKICKRGINTNRSERPMVPNTEKSLLYM
jgi:hypothetical protein